MAEISSYYEIWAAASAIEMLCGPRRIGGFSDGLSDDAKLGVIFGNQNTESL